MSPRSQTQRNIVLVEVLKVSLGKCVLTYEPMLATIGYMLYKKGQVYKVIKPCKTKNAF